MSDQASETNNVHKRSCSSTSKKIKRDTNIDVSRNSSSTSKRLSLSLPKKHKAASPNKTHTCSDENLISMSTTVGHAPVSFFLKTPVTAELQKKEPPHSLSPTLFITHTHPIFKSKVAVSLRAVHLSSRQKINFPETWHTERVSYTTNKNGNFFRNILFPLS